MFIPLATACEECHCDSLGVIACFCADGTCQQDTQACDGPGFAGCDSVCRTHDGVDAGAAVFCPGDGPGTLPPVDGGLQGPHAFPVFGWRMTPDFPEAVCGSASDVLADGGIAAVGLELFSNISTAAACSDAGNPTGLALQIILGTPQFVAANLSADGGPPPTQVLTPGVYTLDNEDVSDQNLCMISPGSDAVMTEFLFITGGQSMPVFNGVGTVTIDQLVAGR